MAMYNTSFTINLADLSFMLRQIKIAEASSLAYNLAPVSILQAIMNEYGMTEEAASLSPFGLRTVDGTFNNLIAGQTSYGAADTFFPRLTDPVYLNDADGDTMPTGPGGPIITNTNYGTTGSVADADPRIISNLIVDLSVNNPAAIEAFLNNPLSVEAFEAKYGFAPTTEWFTDPNNNIPAIVGEQGEADIMLATLPNLSPDIGLSPGFNSWMTIFGQFFDHGLDLVTKGNAGTVYIPLQPDDPLYVEGSPLNFMALTRATVTIDPTTGERQHENTTTSWIDQNQTYTSHSAHQVFLREYVKVGGHAVSTGRLLDGSAATGSLSGSIANWADVKAQAKEMLGIILSDFDVHNVPLIVTDQYGKFIPGANGYAQLVMAPDANNPTNWLQEGTAEGISTQGSIGTNHAFLNDISHHAAPSFVDHDHNPATAKVKQVADTDVLDYNGDTLIDANDVAAGISSGRLTDANGDSVIDILDLADVNLDGVINAADTLANDNNALTYDDEMLNSHFITGDGRGNENIGLSAVHSVFHSEHNRAVEVNKATILASGDLNIINEWLTVDLTELPAEGAALQWDGDRLFQAARFSTEMQYQHMVFEEFARRIQPMVDPFIFTNTADINPSIVAEFAHTVYRFGHSMLTGTVDRLENDLTTVNGEASQSTLLAAFLNPQMYIASGTTAEEANANLIRGLSRDVGSEIDEFIVSDLRDNLVGLPLDLAALNIARGRETGIPSLNETRAQLYAGGAIDLKPYTSWVDFSEHLKNPLSIINFIAAYGTHATLLAATTTEGMRTAAVNLVNAAMGGDQDASDFLNATGAYAGGSLGGLNAVDLWIGGLAEAKNEFGGMLGQTFNFIFEYQMEALQDGDRMYYLSRTQGTNLLNQLEGNTFSDLVMRNTELGDIYSTHLNGFLFVTPDHIFEMDRGIAQTDYNGAAVAGLDPTWGVGEPHSSLQQKVVRSYTGVVADGTHDVGGTFKFLGGEHVVVGGTEGDDKIWTDKGIDTLWGDGGDDYLNAGTESDNVFGGDGDDIIEDPFGDDMLRGNAGNDVIASARGFDILFGDSGNDFIMLGQDVSEVFAGTGDDFILGGSGSDVLLGNEGHDWIEGGAGFDGIAGENSELFFNSPIIGHDVLNGQGNDTDYDGESGDDIMVQGAGIQRNNGMFGFDWAIHKGDMVAADSDLGIPFFPAQVAFTLRDRFDSVEGLSGWDLNDVLTGSAVLKAAAGGAGAGPGNPVNESHLLSQNVGLIDGFAALLGFDTPEELALLANMAVDTTILDTTLGAEIIIGGAGNDTIKGNLGNDILDGDAWLNVRIRVLNDVGDENTQGNEWFTVDSLTQISARLLSGEINPGQLAIVREILQSTTAASDVDTAVFNGAASEYTVVLNTDGSRTVTHTPPVVGGGGVRLDDGVDIIRNFERMQFADQTVVISGSNAVATGDVVISDTAPFEDSVLLATGTNFIDANGINASTLTYTWEAEIHPGQWVNVGTGTLFTPGDAEVGLALRVRANFIDMLGVTETINSDPTAAVQNINDVPVGLPVISGTAEENQTLTVNTAGIIDADGLGTFSYQWTRDGVAFGGTTNPTLILGDADVGAEIAVEVSYTDLNGTTELLTSASTSPVVNVNDVPVGLPVITGIAEENQTLTVNTAGIIDADGLGTFSYQWTRDGVAFGGTTNPTLILGDADVGAEIAVEVSYTDLNGTTELLTSASTSPVVNVNDVPVGLPVITGIAEENQTLTVNTAGISDIDGLGTFSYQWTRDGVAFGGTTDPTLILGDADVGAEIAVEVSYTDLNGTTELLTSASTSPVVNVNDAPTGIVTINDITPDLNQILTASNTLGDLDGLGLINYQWQSLNTNSNLWENVGTNSAIFLTTNAEVGRQLQVVASYTDGAGSAEVVTSNSTATVGAFNIINGTINSETINGTALRDRINGNGGNDILNGLASDDELFGAEGNDLINGGTGVDTMTGGIGHDTYVVDNAGDVVIEAAGGGTDRVNSSITYDLAAGSNVENLTLTGTAAINGTGNELNNTIIGNSAANILTGGAGHDSYVVDNAGDIVMEVAGGGTDRVNSSVTYDLGAGSNVENLTLTGTAAINGTGNELNNTIIGNSADNTLNAGTAGIDTLTGGAGNDTYVVDHAGVTVIEVAGGGTDTVQSSVTTTITNVDVENLTLTGATNINGTGNTADNVIVGNTGNNALSGGAGTDTISGGDGSDTLDGGTGSDTMTGGIGNDTYVVDNASDVVVEAAGGGTDRVNSSVTYDLGAGSNVENLTLTGTAAINGTGNELNNTIIGNSASNTLSGGDGSDTLDGGAGADTLTGGIGNDTYVVDNASDVVVEAAGGGTDRVNSSITFDLGAAGSNVENLTLTGTAAINGTGNELNNTIIGNSASNTLSGGIGSDVLNGGAGADIITGGAGRDTLTGGTGKDVIVIAATTDTGTTAATRDTITDFATVNAATLTNSDLINVNGIDADTALLAIGNQDFTFIGTAAFTAAGQIRYEQIGFNTIIQGNVDAGVGADFSIQLSGLHTLGAADFVL